MGTRGKQIVGLDVSKLLEFLNKAYADEWLAYYQYWIGAKVVRGTLRGAVVPELEEHAQDELRHAGMLATRIIQLGGTPLLSPQDWYQESSCGYQAPLDPVVKQILEQNINSEQCAIEIYRKLAEMVRDKDPITYNIAIEILKDEVEHEEDLESIQQDIEVMSKA